MKFVLITFFTFLFLFSFSQETHKSKPKIGQYFSVAIDIQDVGYSEFEDVLGSENVSFMNKQNTMAYLENAITVNDYYYAINLGYSFSNNRDNDSMNIEFNKSVVGIVFGYNSVNTGDVIVRPEMGFRWYRSRLLNNDKNNKIPLSNYVDDRDLDIRFNNIVGYFGLNFSYKIIDKSRYDFFSLFLGFYFGYNVALNKYSWIFSRRNRLITEKTNNFVPYRVGFYFSFLLN